MEKLKSSLAAKITAVVLVIVSLLLLVAGFTGMAAMDAVGGYQTGKEEMLGKAYEQIGKNYSVIALADYLEQYEADEQMMSNFYYGIVKAKDRNEVDFTNPDSYVATNFADIPDFEKLQVEEYDIGEDSYFEIGKNGILDSYYVNNASNYTNMEYRIDEWLYDLRTETFYARTEESKLFPVSLDNGTIYVLRDGAIDDEFSLTGFHMETIIASETTQEGDVYRRWKEDAILVFNDSNEELSLRDVVIVDETLDMEEHYGEVQKQSPDYISHALGTTFLGIRYKNKSEHYMVASYVNEPLIGAQTFDNGDMFIQAKLCIDFAYQMRYVGVVIAVISLIVLLVSFFFLMASAGHHRGKNGISPWFMDYVPLDLYAAGVCLAETAIIFLVAVYMDAISGWGGNRFSGIFSTAVILLCVIVLALLIVIAYCMSFAVRVKLGKWWRHTLVYLLLKKCLHMLAKCLRLCRSVVQSVFSSMTLLWKAWFLLGGLAFLEFVALEVYWADARLMAFWLMEKIVLYPVMILALMQLKRLQKGARQIAGGQLDYQIDTSHMFWEIRKHGEYLNDIGHGMNSAVNERMKSEHFKTELITNVSHDIKTPLTSIINYVDLLQKEEIDNPTVHEYLEVLHRQSARLKKLIEDLMEASKASTGSLHVMMEKCDAGVMLIQTVGEFEERLMAEQIELQIKKPDTGVFIEADHRHLWRVFDNLMNNICKYAQPSTRAYVNLDQIGPQVMITFRNISRYQLNISSEELMERFVRGDSSRNTEGSGLGISIAKSLTELMDGTFALTVDGDLFKVVLTFPVYGAEKMVPLHSAQQLIGDRNAFEKPDKGDARIMDGIASGIQNAGAYAAEFGQGVADKTGRAVRRAGKYAHQVRQAIRQVKEEEAQLRQADDRMKRNPDEKE